MSKLPVLLVLALFLLSLGFLVGSNYQKSRYTIPTPSQTPILMSPLPFDPCSNDVSDSVEKTIFDPTSCKIRVKYEWGNDLGYSVVVPRDWSFEVAGAAATNLAAYSTGDAPLQALLVGVVHDDLTFNDYDKLRYSYEMSEPQPVINPGEKKLSKEKVTFGTNTYLKVVTDKEEYYFIDNGQSNDKSIYYITTEKASRASQDILEKVLVNFKFEVAE